MRAVLLLAAMALPAAPALSQTLPDWAGYWAVDPALCANASEVGEETPEWIGPDGVFGHEYSCEIARMTPLGVGRAWRLTLDCLDAGFTDRFEEIMILGADDRLYRFDEMGNVSVSTRCAAR